VVTGVVVTALAGGAIAVLDREQPATRIRTGAAAAAAAPIDVTVESRVQLAAPGYGPFVVASGPNVVWVGDARDETPSGASSPVLGLDPRTGETLTTTAVSDM
jgi:hypothetical protein